MKMDEDGDTIINEQLKRGKERRGLGGRRRREEDAKRKQNKKIEIFFFIKKLNQLENTDIQETNKKLRQNQ